jgi:hypothetical protein
MLVAIADIRIFFWRVLTIDTVGTSQFVEDEQSNSHKKTTSVALDQEDLLEDLNNSVTSLDFLLSIDLSADLSILQIDILVVSWKLADLAQVVQTLLSLVVTDQVTSTLRSKEDHCDEENTWSDLNTERCLPLVVRVVFWVVVPS